MNHFFVEKYDKKMAKIRTIFLIFCSFSCFFWILDKSHYDLPIVLQESGYPIGGKEFFFGFICFYNIKKNTEFFQFFSSSCF